MKTTEMFDLSKTMAKPLFERFTYPEEVLEHITDYITEIIPCLDPLIYTEMEKDVWTANSAKISPNATLTAPCIIGENTEVRQCAFIRGSVIIGNNCVVGNSSEVKNSILFDRVQVPHFNYVGDSILGFAAHMGAGAVTSNVKSDKTEVSIIRNGEKIKCGRRKIGAILGDSVEIGCGAVLCPGTVIGKNTTVYPLSLVRGTIPPDMIYKDKENIVFKI